MGKDKAVSKKAKRKKRRTDRGAHRSSCSDNKLGEEDGERKEHCMCRKKNSEQEAFALLCRKIGGNEKFSKRKHTREEKFAVQL